MESGERIPVGRLACKLLNVGDIRSLEPKRILSDDVVRGYGIIESPMGFKSSRALLLETDSEYSTQSMIPNSESHPVEVSLTRKGAPSSCNYYASHGMSLSEQHRTYSQ